MISFIVIGRNEGWKLTKSIQSIIDTIKDCELSSFEIIYVDSDSSDNSVERAKKFVDIKIFKLTGDLNAGIARNVGAQRSKGDVLFFIDGDMEIQSEFLGLVYSEKNGLIHDFVSGNWMNYYYDLSGELLRKDKYKEMKTDAYEKVTGGFFLINKNTWDLVGGINEDFKISEDIDIGLRLAKKNIFLLRKKDIGVIHHTIDYFDKKRMWRDFLNMDHLYGRSLLYRTHLFNRHMYHRWIRFDYTLLLLILTIILILLFPDLWIFFASIYFIALIIRGKLSPRKIVFNLLRDLTVLLGLLFFFPKRNDFSIKKMN